MNFLQKFWLSENSKISEYIFPILEEHKIFLQNIFLSDYELFDAKLRENLRFWDVFIELNEEEKFLEMYQTSGTEMILQLFFAHPDAEKFSWPGSVIKIELSHNSFSGSF